MHLHTLVFTRLLNCYAEKIASGIGPFQTKDSMVPTPRTVPTLDHGGKMYHTKYANMTVSISEQCEAANQTKRIRDQYRHLFANLTTADDDIHPVTVAEISEAQQNDKHFKRYFKDKPFKDS